MNRSVSNSNSNRSPSNSLPLRKAITGFLNFKTAAGLSQRSVDSYQRILEQWADLAGSEVIRSAHLAEALQYCPKLMLG